MICKMLEKACKKGINVPFAHDPVEGAPSVTLLFFYVGFLLASSVIAASSIYLLIAQKFMEATFMPTVLLGLGFVFYRMHKLDKFKFDLSTRSFELDAGDEPPKVAIQTKDVIIG